MLKSDYLKIIEVWESSVRATHHFLSEEDIQYFKPLILNQYLDAVALYCTKNANGSITGFAGIADLKYALSVTRLADQAPAAVFHSDQRLFFEPDKMCQQRVFGEFI